MSNRRPPVSESTPSDRRVFRVSPLSYIGLGVIVIAILVPVSSYPLQLSWLILLPLAFAWWIARTRTKVADDGLHIRNWRGSRFLAWEDVKGVNFPKSGFAQAVTTGDEHVRLSAIGFVDLPRLSEVSGGRILDPFAAAEAAAAAEEAEFAEREAERKAAEKATDEQAAESDSPAASEPTADAATESDSPAASEDRTESVSRTGTETRTESDTRPTSGA